MSRPGETNHVVGQAYVKVLVGCLEYTVKPFQKQFDIYTNPEKLTFAKAGGGGTFSFDAMGTYIHPSKNCEMFIESKGYTSGASLLSAYREFIAKAYVTKCLNLRHSNDHFCFVTNVPFGSSEGRNLTSTDFILQKALNREADEQVKSILGEITLDRDHIESLSQKLSLCFFTDSFIRISGITYKVKEDESLWTIIEDIHAKQLPNRPFTQINSVVQAWNPQVRDPDLIVSGESLHLPWYGIDLVELG
jgi:hypothetical protein